MQANMKSGAPEHTLITEAAAERASKGHRKQKHASAPNPLAVKKASKTKTQQSESSQNKSRIRRKRQSAKEDVG